MAYADLHIHSNYSYDGTVSIEKILITAAEETQLSILAITDHDEIEGALLAENISHKYGLSIVIGSEITTVEGHLLALFLRKRIPVGLSLNKTLELINQQGGLCVIPHPEARFTKSISLKSVAQALDTPLGQKTLVGIEVFNAGIFRSQSNSKAMEFALNNDVSITANSDAHSASMIGRAATGFNGSSIDDLRHALVNHQTYIIRSYPINDAIIVLSWLHDKLSFKNQDRTKQPSPLSA